MTPFMTPSGVGKDNVCVCILHVIQVVFLLGQGSTISVANM